MKTKINIRFLMLAVILAAAAAGLYFISVYNYTFFKALIELTSIVFGVSAFIITIGATYLSKNGFMILIATGIFTSSIFDFLHLLSFKGIEIFKGFDEILSSQLWVTARFIQVAVILAAVFIIKIILSKKCIAAISAIFSALFLCLVLVIFIFRMFPAIFIAFITYIIPGLAVVAILLYTIKRQALGKRNYIFITVSLALLILSEISFIVTSDTYGIIAVAGHFFKLASFYFIFRFFIETNIKDPYIILFNNLKGTSEKLQFITTHDNLTGLMNQSSVLEEIKKQLDISKRFKKPFSIIIIDIDDFKKLNDMSGHPAGDEALRYFSEVIRNSVRDVDIKGRYGGDEFIISPLEVSSANAIKIAQKIQDTLNVAILAKDSPFEKFQISAGVSGIRANRSLEDIIGKAEKALLKSKKLGKNRITLMR